MVASPMSAVGSLVVASATTSAMISWSDCGAAKPEGGGSAAGGGRQAPAGSDCVRCGASAVALGWGMLAMPCWRSTAGQTCGPIKEWTVV